MRRLLVFGVVLAVAVAGLGPVEPVVARPHAAAADAVPDGAPRCGTEAPPGPSARAWPPLPPTPAIRIGTYNVLQGLGDPLELLDARLPHLRDAILAGGADVVGVQEVEEWASRGYTAARLSRLLADSTGVPWSWCFFMANPFVAGTTDVYVGGGNPQSDQLMLPSSGEPIFRTGVGVLSRYPILGGSARRLPPRVPEEVDACTTILCQVTVLAESRVALRTLIETPGGPAHVVSVHLSNTLTSESARTREVQTADLLQWIDGFSASSPYPVVLTGDFNSQETTAVHAAVRVAGFVDTFRVANPVATGSRIDYVFARRGSCPSPLSEGSGVLGSVVIGTEDVTLPDGTVTRPSDHPGYVSELRPFPRLAGDRCAHTARFPAELLGPYLEAARFFGIPVEDLPRAGIQLLAFFGWVAGEPLRAPPAVDNSGPLAVTTEWKASDVRLVDAATAYTGLGADDAHHAGARLVIFLHELARSG